jgi:hypothetical protein
MSVSNWGLFGSNVSSQRSRLWVLRAFFFGILGYDLIAITFKHAARYGVDGFNVPHVAWLDGVLPIPDPMLVGCLWSLCALATVFVVLNIYTTPAIRVVACIYGGVYFWSQIDSYQHHYLNAIVAMVLALMPADFWAPPTHTNKAQPTGSLIGMLYVQLGLIYLWTAMAKLDVTWLSGATLMSIGHIDQLLVGTSYISELLYGTAGDPILAHDALYETLSYLVVTGEMIVAFCFFCPRLRTLGLILAPTFHLSVEYLGLDIELFSVYMIGINLILLSPNGLWERLDKWRNDRVVTVLPNFLHSQAPVILCLATLVSASLLFKVPFGAAQTPILSILLSGSVCLIGAWTFKKATSAHQVITVSIALLAAGIVVPYGLNATGAIYDYHRMLGGDLSRRLPHAQSQDYESRLKHSVDVYGIANAAMPSMPARREKQARLVLKGSSTERFEHAVTLLTEAYEIHMAHIGRLDRLLERAQNTERLEQLIKAEHGLAAVCKTMRKIPNQYRSLSDRQLNLTIDEMRVSSATHLSRLAQQANQSTRNGLEAIFESLIPEGRFDRSQDHLTATVSSQPGTKCDETLKRLGKWALLSTQMRLGRKDSIREGLMSRVHNDAHRCEARFTYPVAPIISARMRRLPLTKLRRNQTRVFGK